MINSEENFCFDLLQNDLAEIKTQYAKKTGQPLKEVVVKKMKGDLEKILLQLLGN